MSEVIEFRPNELHYSHAICASCWGESFYIKTTDDNKFYSIICTNCENEIFCDLQPIFKPEEE